MRKFYVFKMHSKYYAVALKIRGYITHKSSFYLAQEEGKSLLAGHYEASCKLLILTRCGFPKGASTFKNTSLWYKTSD